MKFARYLEDTQIPEWKKAYIDYRGLKKRITAIRLTQEQINAGAMPLISPATPTLDTQTVQTSTRGHDTDDDVPAVTARDSIAQISAGLDRRATTESDSADHSSHVQRPSSMILSAQSPQTEVPPSFQANPEPGPSRSQKSGVARAATLNMGFLPRLRRSTGSRNPWENSRRTGKATLQWDLAKSIPLKDLIPLLLPVQRAFFEKLDVELDKIETFFVDREKEMRARVNTLKAQLQELQDHRRIFYDAQSAGSSWLPLIRSKMGPMNHNGLLSKTNVAARKRRSYKADNDSPKRHSSPKENNNTLEEEIENVDSNGNEHPSPSHEVSDDTLENNGANSSGSGGSGGEDVPKGWKKVRYNFQKHNVAKKSSPVTAPVKYDPDEYLHAKKRLKKAVLECYRGLEVLENYRTLNMIGFRKALKKFEKYTQIPAQQAYFNEKIEPSAFSSGTSVLSMLNEMEDLYAARFTRGDNKLAKTRLRGHGLQHKTHHFSTFRTGLLLGLALPAFVDGIYLSFKHETREALPGYAGLYYVFSVFLIPVLFSFLVGLNILAWSKSRINYTFIFEFDLKTKLDHREYFEIPALLLSALSYAFWLSFARIGTSHFSPTLWPLIWLAFCVVVLLSPFPIWFKQSRWWLLKITLRLLTPAFHRVEFADFWMGDQFCSLVFSLSNIYLVVCAYSGGLDVHWNRCLSPRPWGVPFLLAALPLLVRLIQSVKRWVDSKLVTHLINGGKYGAGVIYYLVYFNWRHHGGARGGEFALFIIFGVIYALYASAWDFLMDWSLLRPHAKYPLLRGDLLYTGKVPLYYFALVSNVLIRFVWVLYIPEKGPSFAARTVIAALLEMLRRWQWNFYRLENEHLGNVDQYRVTREVPLPYSFDEPGHETDIDDDDQKSISSWRSRRRAAKAQEFKDRASQIGDDSTHQ